MKSKFSENFNSTIAFKIYLIFTLVLIGILLLICRNSDPIIHPIIYAEDGDWIGLGLTRGWFYPLLHARPDYLVIGNIVLLWLATQCSMVLFGNPIMHLPESIAFISCVFYSMAAVLVFYSTKDIIPLIFRGVLFFLLLLVPLGFSQNEIIGRIVQVGHYMTLLAILFFYFKSKCNSYILKRGIDFFLLLCAATSPLVIGLALLYFLWDTSKNSNIWKVFTRDATLNIPLVILSIYLLPRVIGDHTNRLQGLFDIRQLIEAIGARAVLFPMIFPWYSKLSNTVTICLLIAWILLVVYAYLQSKDCFGKRLMLFLSVGLMVVIAATILMRPALTTGFNKYQTTSLDRYFFGINVLTIFLTILALGQLALSSGKINVILGWVGLGAIILIYCFHLSFIFEIHSSKLPIMGKATFEDQVKSVQITSSSTSIDVPIYPTMWKMQIPTRWVNMLKNEK